MRNYLVCFLLALLCTPCFTQMSDQEEFEFNRRLAKTSKSVLPAEGFVTNKETAIAIAYAISLPVYGKKQLDSELPFRAELKDGVWTVLGTLKCQNCEGGTLVVLIDKPTGKILFMTHTM